MYRLNVYNGNQQEGYYFHQQNIDRIRENKTWTFVFVLAIGKEPFEWLHKELF